MTKTYAAVQHAPQKISIDHLENGQFISQVSFWFSSREAAKVELKRLCDADQVQAFSAYVVGLKDVGLTSEKPAISVEDVVEEVGNIATGLTDTPIYFLSKSTSEGIEAMIQAAAAFTGSKNAAERADAALWIGEAYLIFSASLPDTGHGEKSTSWATARQIANLLGGPEVWEAKVRSEFSK